MLLICFQRFPLVIVLFINICFSLYVKAEVSINNIKPQVIYTPEIKVVTEYLEPFQIKNDNGTLGGIATEIIYALFTQMNKPLNIKVMPWARAYRIAINEKNTLIYSIARTPARENKFHWLVPIAKEEYFFWGLKTQFHLPIESIDQLKSYKISASRDSNVEAYLLSKQFTNIYQLVTEDQSLLMLSTNRIDLMLETQVTLKYRADRLGLSLTKLRKVSVVKELNSELYFALSKQTDIATVKLFNKAFQALDRQGIIRDIKHKWGIN